MLSYDYLIYVRQDNKQIPLFQHMQAVSKAWQ